MAEVYCDVVPHANGWVFYSDGGQSPAFPSYRLAIEAAHCHVTAVGRQRSIILREQGLNGSMRRIGEAAVPSLSRQVKTGVEVR